MWGIIPAAGNGTRIQPLAFSKELLPVGSRFDGNTERPRAVSEYLIERMLQGGADKICFVISRWKFDILQYYGGEIGDAAIAYMVQPEAKGLCDALFRAVPVTRPELFDAVVTDDAGRVREIQVKREGAESNWVWGAFRMPGSVLHALHRLWQRRRERDEFIGTLVNAYLATGGEAVAVPVGTAYVDVGTLGGYREAMRLLSEAAPPTSASRIAPFPVALRPVAARRR